MVARSACVQPVAHLQGALACFARATRARTAQVQVSFFARLEAREHGAARGVGVG